MGQEDDAPAMDVAVSAPHPREEDSVWTAAEETGTVGPEKNVSGRDVDGSALQPRSQW